MASGGSGNGKTYSVINFDLWLFGMKKLLTILFLFVSLTAFSQRVSTSVYFAPPVASGGATYTDDFEAYSAGNLDNQGEWRAVCNRIDVLDDDGDNVIQAYTAAYCAYAYDDTFADDQYAEGTLGDTGEGFIGLAVRLQADDSGDGYIALFRPAGVALGKIDNGSYTSLGTYAPGTAPASGMVVRLQVSGTTIKAFVNGIERVSVTDSDYSSGRAGVSGYENGTARLIDWEGGDL